MDYITLRIGNNLKIVPLRSIKPHSMCKSCKIILFTVIGVVAAYATGSFIYRKRLQKKYNEVDKIIVDAQQAKSIILNPTL